MRRFLVSAIALALAGGSVAVAAAPPSASASAPPKILLTTQLPRSVPPTHYDTAVVPHAQALTFDGQATIVIDVLGPTDRITLHARKTGVRVHFFLPFLRTARRDQGRVRVRTDLMC